MSTHVPEGGPCSRWLSRFPGESIEESVFALPKKATKKYHFWSKMIALCLANKEAHVIDISLIG